VKAILLIGKNGQVGWELQHSLRPLGHVIALDRTQMDLTQPDTIRNTIRLYSPDIIVNAAGYTAVDKAEQEPDLAMQVNAVAPGILAEESKRLNALLVHYSTDYVFDGTHSTPYTEEDEPNPVNVYGKSKLEGERAITATGCLHLILRTSWIYSARGTNFVLTILKLAREKAELLVVDDQIGSPTAARELAKTTSEILGKLKDSQARRGVFHLSASGYASRFEFAKKIIETARKISGTQSGWADVRATKTQHYPLPAARPLNASTSKEKITRAFGSKMLTWDQQLDENLKEIFWAAIG
jgi:dTDP-4-dehydrorhamnose reductase